MKPSIMYSVSRTRQNSHIARMVRTCSRGAWRTLAAALLLAGAGLRAGETVGTDDTRGRDAGGTGKDFDLPGFIERELKAGKQRIVVPPGRYRVEPTKAQHLALRNLKSVTIIADGVEMICTQTTRALTISNCTELALRGLVIDYDPLPYTQGRIIKLSPDKKVHDIELFDGYPRAETANPSKYEIFRPDTRTLRCPCYGVKVEAVDSAHLRLTKSGGSTKDLEEVGDIIAIGSDYAPGGSAAHAVECSGNKKVTLEDISLYGSNCFGFLEYNCEASTYLRCRVDRRPAESDPVKRADPRIRSLNADAFHSKHATVGPRLIECVARFQGDDCLNICGDYHMVMGSAGKALRVLAKHDMNIQAGDPVELVAYSGARLPDAVATAIEKDEGIRPDEVAFLRKQRMDEGLRTNRGALTKGFKIILDREVELPMGSVICSTRRVGNGFLVERCEFGFNRSRGILIKASDGKITHCKLQGNWEVGILVSPEFWWLEAGSSNNLIIQDNVISDCPTPGIVVQATGGNGKVAPSGAHRNITVSGNSFANCSMPYILCTSTDGLTLSANRFPETATPKQAGWGGWMVPKEDKGKPVVTVNCVNGF